VGVGDGHLVVVGRLCVEAAVDLVARGEIEIQDLEAVASRLDQCFSEGVNANVVGFTGNRLDAVGAVGLDVVHGHDGRKVVGMRLHPGTGKELRGSGDDAADGGGQIAYFDIGDDGHGFVHVVEGFEQDGGGEAVHALQRVGELAQQLKGGVGKVDPDVARVADVVEHVAHGVEAGFLVAKLVDVARAQQGLEVGEGDGWRGSADSQWEGATSMHSPRHPQWPSPRQVR
jgi:hypothetical protein